MGLTRPGTDDGATITAIPRAVMAIATGTSMAALGGKSFWTSTAPAVTAIQVTLMTPSATTRTWPDCDLSLDPDIGHRGLLLTCDVQPTVAGLARTCNSLLHMHTTRWRALRIPDAYALDHRLRSLHPPVPAALGSYSS